MNMKVIERPRPRKYSSEYDSVYEKLKSLSTSQALEVEIPEGKSAMSFRNGLANALNVRGLKVTISLDNKNNKLIIWLKH